MSVTIVTGSIDAGKSSWMMDQAALPDRAGWVSEKLFSPAAGESELIGYDLLFIPSGRRLPLARLLTIPAGGDWFSFRRFRFNQETFDAATASLNSLLESAPREIILDEVGPLELEGRGFAPLLGELLEAGVDLCLSVRPALTGEIADQFGFRPSRIVRL